MTRTFPQVQPRRSPIRLTLVQMSCNRTREENLQHAARNVVMAARRGAQIVCLPELFTSPYFCQRPDDRVALEAAESLGGPLCATLSSLARENAIVLIGGTFLERDENGRYFNTATIFNEDGQLLDYYRKSHIPEDPLFHEQQYFAAGDTGLRIVDTLQGKIAVQICYDQWFPEAARTAALAGAELLIYPSAIGHISKKHEPRFTGHWQQMWWAAQLGNAVMNNIHVAAVNRVGIEDGLNFWGGSFIADPAGVMLAQAGDKEELLSGLCDFERARQLREDWGFFRNRRTDLYHLDEESA